MKLPLNCSYTENDWNIYAEFWHPVAYSYDVQDKPVGVVLLDQEVVIYRTEKGITAANGLCPHRGTRLSLGTIENDNIVCAYHAFQFNGEGKCTKIPAAGEGAKIPASLCLKTFNIQEKYGLVWVCLKEPRVELADWSAMDDDSMQKFRMKAQTWDANATRFTENFNDVAHFPFVHRGTFGNPDEAEVQKYTVENNDVGFIRKLTVQQLDQNTFTGTDVETKEYYYTYDITLPFQSTIHILSQNDENEWIFSVPSPVSMGKTKIFMMMAKDFGKEAPSEDYSDFQQAVVNEDEPIVINQLPKHVPLDLAHDFHIEADTWSIAYRKGLKALGIEGRDP